MLQYARSTFGLSFYVLHICIYIYVIIYSIGPAYKIDLNNIKYIIYMHYYNYLLCPIGLIYSLCPNGFSLLAISILIS